MLDELRRQLQALERPAGLADGPGLLPLDVPAIDAALGGGLARGALHEIAALSEAHMAAAAGFALGVALSPSARSNNTVISPAAAYGFRVPAFGRPRNGEEKAGRGEFVWVVEDMALAESGAPYGAGLDAFGLAPERLVTVSVAQRRDLLWAMEEALRCRAVGTVIGELRAGAIDGVAVRRLSLAAADTGTLALLLRTAPPADASTAATRWVVGASPSVSSVVAGRPESIIPVEASGFRVRGLTAAPQNDDDMRSERTPRFAVTLARNRRGPGGSWILEWSEIDERFLLAAPARPVAAPPFDRPHRAVA